MKRIGKLILLLMIVTASSAQNIEFFSPEFEEGVKRHLGLDANAFVSQQQMDTITTINLSGLGIKDIRDVVYLSSVKELDLSYNEIKDVSPLLPLDSLYNVDLRSNLLEDISLFPFANSDSLVISVAYNYITDFSRFFLSSDCHISIIGMSAQRDRKASYLDVYQLFMDIEKNNPIVCYRGYSNQQNIYIACQEKHQPAIIDGNFQRTALSVVPDMSTKVFVTDGIRGDSTWVIPLQRLTVRGGEELSIETGLPDDYSITFANANSGTVTVAGQTVTYQAPTIAVPDTILLSYYQGDKLRGQARYLINSVLLGDVNGEGRVDEVDAQQILDVSAGVKSLGELTVPEAVGVPGGSSNALEVNAQKVLDYSVAGDKPW